MLYIFLYKPHNWENPCFGIIAGKAFKNQFAGFFNQIYHQMESLDFIDFFHVDRTVEEKNVLTNFLRCCEACPAVV